MSKNSQNKFYSNAIIVEWTQESRGNKFMQF